MKLLLGTDEKEAFVCRQVPVFVVKRQGFSEHCQSGPCADSSVNESSRYRDAGNGFSVWVTIRGHSNSITKP